MAKKFFEVRFKYIEPGMAGFLSEMFDDRDCKVLKSLLLNDKNGEWQIIDEKTMSAMEYEMNNKWTSANYQWKEKNTFTMYPPLKIPRAR